MITKTQLKEHLKDFPDEFSLDDLIERLILVEKIERGIQQSKNTDVISEFELDREIEKWLK